MALNALLTKLQTAGQQSKKFQEALQQLGLSAQQLEQDIGQDAQGALLKFLEALEQLDKQKRSEVLADLFGAGRQADMALLVGGLEAYKKAVAMMAQETTFAGSMQQELSNLTTTTANQLQLLKNGLTEVGINLGTVLLPPLNAFVGVLRGATTQLAKFAEEHPILTKLIMGTTAALIGGKVAAIGLGYAWTFIQGGALALATVWRGLLITMTLVRAGLIGINSASLVTAVRMGALAFGGAIRTLGVSFMALASRVFPAVITGFQALTGALVRSPLGILVSGIVAAAALVITNWASVKNFFLTIWEPIKPIWEVFGQWVSEFWEKITSPFKSLGSLWNNLWGKAPEISAPVMQPANKALQTPLPITPKTVEHKTQNNTFNIKVHATPNQDSRAIAEEILHRLKEQTRGALYDPVGALP